MYNGVAELTVNFSTGRTGIGAEQGVDGMNEFTAQPPPLQVPGHEIGCTAWSAAQYCGLLNAAISYFISDFRSANSKRIFEIL